MKNVSRRGMLRALGLAVVSVPLIRAIAACTDRVADGPDASGSDAASDTGAVGDDWATGGTAAMTAAASYPDPFASAAATCALICETTEGPCTTASSLARKDVSEGLGGLPVRLALQIVGADDCAPIAGAVVEIWHTQKSGVYSGVTPNPQMCNGSDTAASSAMYFRGTQTTDANGRVDFDTCYPGWYASRAVHIHVQVTVGGMLLATTQLFFADALTASIYSTHVDYKARGQPDTVDTTDNVIGGETDQTPYILATARMTDGAMLASKRLAIRRATTDASCSAKGAGGGPPGP